jgi:hypothetical protein
MGYPEFRPEMQWKTRASTLFVVSVFFQTHLSEQALKGTVGG